MKKKSVVINSKVTLSCNNVIKSYFIVPSEELDSAVTKISNISPLGKLLLESKEKDKVKLNSPSGIIEYEVISVEK